jgi:hypothetical protein
MTDYMDNDHEQRKHPTAKKAFEQIADGRPEVFHCLWSFWNFAHVFDDLVDEGTWPMERKEQAMKALHDFVVTLLLNPFVRDHAHELRAVFVQAIARSLDGDRMATDEDAAVRALAPAVRCGDVDVILQIAYLAGGYSALRTWGKLREYDQPDVTQPQGGT